MVRAAERQTPIQLMKNETAAPVIQVDNLVRKYGPTEAVNGLSFAVRPGQCYGFFGRNGAGKTTTIKCLLNLLQPTAGTVRLFGLDPARNEVEVKRRLAYVPDQVAFYPWLTVDETLRYLESFRLRWNREKEAELLARVDLDPRKKTGGLSKGQKTQLALIAAICPEPELLILDEPTSGLDPIVRREFIQTVIGAFQEGDPGSRTILVSTHLISEFEGLIDTFTVIDHGRAKVSLDADQARDKYKRIRARFGAAAPPFQFPGMLSFRREGRELEIVANGESEAILKQLATLSPEAVVTESLNLEEIFVATVRKKD
jgi:ABC-type multidrug transport system ATPase subunit